MKRMARAAKGKARSVLFEENIYQGICPSCVNLEICSFVRKSEGPVFYCEEFDDDDGSARKSVHRVQEGISEEKDCGGNHAGLCTTCENRDGCVFSRREGGIWHCEEYR